MTTSVPSSVTPLLVVQDLHRTFGGVRAVDGLTFAIPRGGITGFIGANGAGKTTTMRILATLDQPDRGSIHLDGIDALGFPDEVRKRIGWMPDSYGTYKNMTVFEYLDFFARSYGLRGAARRSRVQEVMDFTDLTPLMTRILGTLSKGMGQRLCLGRTLLHDPDFLILDEPAAGLDPKARVEFKNLVAQLKTWGKTVLISSHILSELGEMCDELLFIDAGRILHHGTSDSLLHDPVELPLYLVHVAGDPARFQEWISMQPDLVLDSPAKSGARIRVAKPEPEIISGIIASILRAGFLVTEFHREEARLEETFVRMVRGAALRTAVDPPPLPTDMPRTTK